MDQSRLSAHEATLVKAEETLKKLVDQLNYINGDFAKSTNLICVKKCNLCQFYAWTPDTGFFCYRTKAAITKDDFCSRYEPKKSSLCWDCDNATSGGCSWTEPLTAEESNKLGRIAKFEPVEGWTAIPNNSDGEQGYLVLACPSFKGDTLALSKDIEEDIEDEED